MSVKGVGATSRGTWVTMLGTVCRGGHILPAVSMVSSLWLRRHIGPPTSTVQPLSLFLNEKLEGCPHVTTSQICYHFTDILWFNIVGNLNCNNMVCFPMGLNYGICISNAIKGSKNATLLLNHPGKRACSPLFCFAFCNYIWIEPVTKNKTNPCTYQWEE